MDLITQGILGAAVAQVGFQKQLGRRALAWGAIAGMIPDLDVIVKFSSNPFAEMLYHRGITHSLWFGPVLGPVMGYIVWRWYNGRGREDSLSAWIGLMIWALLTHPLLDVFTVYGTQLLAPFSNHRFALSAVPIIDPIYSLTLLFAVFLGVFFHKRMKIVVSSATVALTLTSAYLFFGLAQNEIAERICRKQFCNGHSCQAVSIKAYTTMFQLFWRRLVVEDADAIHVGFLSTWSPKPIQWHSLKKPQNLPGHQFLEDNTVGIFTWFSNEQYGIQYDEDNKTVTMTDLRFGFEGPSIYGLWGIEFAINEKGERVTPVVKVKYPVGPITGRRIIKIFQDAFA